MAPIVKPIKEIWWIWKTGVLKPILNWDQLTDTHEDLTTSYPSLPLLWMASSSVIPSSDLKASQSSLDFSSVLILAFFPPILPRMLPIPAGRLELPKKLKCGLKKLKKQWLTVVATVEGFIFALKEVNSQWVSEWVSTWDQAALVGLARPSLCHPGPLLCCSGSSGSSWLLWSLPLPVCWPWRIHSTRTAHLQANLNSEWIQVDG